VQILPDDNPSSKQDIKQNNKAIIEAALFVSDKPPTVEQLGKTTGVPQEEVAKIAEQIRIDLEVGEHGYELVETPEGYEYRVRTEYRDKVSKLAPFADLSTGMMRTLAIVAAKQPVKQSLIVKYQGNKTYKYIGRLEEKGLIKSEKYRRTKLLQTTSEFEKYFGTSSEQIKAMLEKK
jgi:segregation and condensation protein B